MVGSSIISVIYNFHKRVFISLMHDISYQIYKDFVFLKVQAKHPMFLALRIYFI